MTYKVCVVSGTRADYGPLRELLFRLKKNELIDLDILVTGSHLSDSFGNTQDELLKDGFDGYSKLEIPIDDDTKCGMAKATGMAVCKFADYFQSIAPDLVVVLGDRYEILAAVIAARMEGISVAHISGGDVTEGAIDDSIRHSVTKMSQLHFPGCEQSRKRIIQMGEKPETVFNVGEPGVENCLNTDFMDRDCLAESLGFEAVKNDYALVTFHPVTMEDNTGVKQVRELITALDNSTKMSYIITMSNSDAGGRAINDLWKEEIKKHNNWILVSSLGVRRYLSAMKYAKMVIGNSSSGIIEAPSMGVPTVNIGDRQKGRMMAESVITCLPDSDSISSAIRTALSNEFQDRAKNVVSPFGDGTTSKRIEEIIILYLEHKEDFKKTENQFYDIEFEIGALNGER